MATELNTLNKTIWVLYFWLSEHIWTLSFSVFFCQFFNSAWIKFFVWFTSLLILGFIPDQTFPEVTTRRQKLCVKSKTEFKVNISVKKYKGEKRNKKRVTKENIEVLLRPQWLICWCEEWQERKGKSLVKYDNLALEAFTF